MIRILRDWDMEPEKAEIVQEVATIGMAEKIAKSYLRALGKYGSVKIVGENVEKMIFFDPEQGVFDLYDALKHKIFSFIKFTYFLES